MKNKFKLTLKSFILLILINCILTGTISYVAAEIVIDAKNVGYTDNAKLGVDNVQEAIDSTCTKVNTVQEQVNELNTTLSTKQDKLSSSLGAVSSNGTVIASTIATGVDSYKKIRSLTLSAGKYIISYTIAFPTNYTGLRTTALQFGESTTNIQGTLRVAANPGGYTNLSASLVANLSSETTIYLVGQQTSGSNMTLVGSGLWALRVW